MSTIILVLIFLLCFLFPYMYELSAYDLNPTQILLPPSFEHILGTDRLGRDLMARVMHGGQISLIIGILSSIIASFIGLMVGISAGFFQKGTDKIIIVMIDLFLTFPTFFLLLALISYMSASIWVLIIVISITGWMGMARMIRSESFAISNAPFIKILKLSHVGNLKIIMKYFAPLLAPIFFISFTFGVSGAILAESGLSFFPGLLIFLVTFSLIQISDYLQAKSNEKDILNEA